MGKKVIKSPKQTSVKKTQSCKKSYNKSQTSEKKVIKK